jgi:hypothetical protein
MRLRHLTALFLCLVISGSGPAWAYLGPCAPTDTLVWHYAVNDTSPSAANPTTVKAYFYLNGVLYDSTGMSGTTIRYWLPTKGMVWGKVNASSGATTYGFGQVQYRTTIQSLVIATSDSWTVDSLHMADGNIRNLDGSVAAAKTLTTQERVAIRDTVYHDNAAVPRTLSPSAYAEAADTVWHSNYSRLRSLSSNQYSLMVWDTWMESAYDDIRRAAYGEIADSVATRTFGVSPAAISAIADSVAAQAVADTDIKTALQIIMGLLDQNYMIDETQYIGQYLTSARVRVFTDATLLVPVATYRITGYYEGQNLERYEARKE